MAETSRKSRSEKLKNPVQKMAGNSYNPQQELLGLLKSKCPAVFTEGKIDAGKLKQTLGEELDTNNERYGLTWAGKTECFRHIQETTTDTLKPCRKESVDFDTTENIFIEGDNLEVLKILQKTYQNKIKMIYIDPPYNTGNDSFIYPDRFKEEKEDYEQRAGIKDAEGLLTKDGFWRKNSKDAGHFHSNWLSMMYPRLFLAKNLLREDGVIFVSIDDNEIQNLRMIMDEVFGEENFFCQIIVRSNSRGQTYKQIAKTHEYLLAYLRNPDTELFELEKEGDRQDLDLTDNIGPFNLRELRNRNPKFGRHNRPNLFYPFYVNETKEGADGFYPISLKKGNGFETKVEPFDSQGRESCWRWGQTLSQANININTLESNLVAKRKNFGSFLIYEKYRKTTYKPKSIWDDNCFLNETGTVELRDLEIGNLFDFPKPIGLIEQCTKLSCDLDDDIVLDFFAGSGTTAHAIMALNAEDGGNRKFICVQLAEPCEEESEAFKAGFKTIADIGKERIRRAAKKIADEIEGNLKFDKNRLDLGFKVFKLDQSNFKQWRENIKTGGELKEQMRMFVDNVKKGAGSEDMLFEIILKNSRFDLNVKISKESFDGVDYCRLVDGVEIICLAPKITKKSVDKIISLKPEKFTCLDTAFKNNDQLKTNTALQMEAAKIEFKVI
jgi:adenine-specific DNA-methyltransferase